MITFSPAHEYHLIIMFIPIPAHEYQLLIMINPIPAHVYHLLIMITLIPFSQNITSKACSLPCSISLNCIVSRSSLLYSRMLSLRANSLPQNIGLLS